MQTYNSTVQSFPTNIIAGFYHFQTKPYFQASAGAEKRAAGELQLQRARHQRRNPRSNPGLP